MCFLLLVVVQHVSWAICQGPSWWPQWPVVCTRVTYVHLQRSRDSTQQNFIGNRVEQKKIILNCNKKLYTLNVNVRFDTLLPTRIGHVDIYASITSSRPSDGQEPSGELASSCPGWVVAGADLEDPDRPHCQNCGVRPPLRSRHCFVSGKLYSRLPLLTHASPQITFFAL